MSRPERDLRIDYIELPATDLPRAKAFYHNAFGWEFTDYGDEYSAFNDGALDGGIAKMDPDKVIGYRGALVVLYAVDLEAARATVLELGGRIETDIFSFPGGRRFHFFDTEGNVLAIWSDPE